MKVSKTSASVCSFLVSILFSLVAFVSCGQAEPSGQQTALSRSSNPSPQAAKTVTHAQDSSEEKDPASDKASMQDKTAQNPRVRTTALWTKAQLEGRLPAQMATVSAIDRAVRAAQAGALPFTAQEAASWRIPRPAGADMPAGDWYKDPLADLIRVVPAPNGPQRGNLVPYFEQKVPRIIHRIDFATSRAKPLDEERRWPSYAQTFGYDLVVWTETSVSVLEGLMPAPNFALWSELLARGEPAAAADVARASILRAQGGISVGPQVLPPRWNGEEVDFSEILPLRNMLISSAAKSRYIYGSSLTITPDQIFATTINHPLAAALEEQLPTHAGEWMARREFSHDHVTGAVLTSRLADGAVQIVPPVFLLQYGMISALH